MPDDKIIIEYLYIGKPFVMSDGTEWNPPPGWHKWKAYTKQSGAEQALETLTRHFGNIYEFRIKENQ